MLRSVGGKGEVYHHAMSERIWDLYRPSWSIAGLRGNQVICEVGHPRMVGLVKPSQVAGADWMLAACSDGGQRLLSTCQSKHLGGGPT